MKIPTNHVALDDLGYEGYWVEMPRSLKEGQLQAFAKVSAPKDGEEQDDSATARAANIKILELVTAWNLDDDAGKIYPVLSKVKTTAEKERIVSELPVDVIIHIAQMISGSIKVPEAVKDF